MQTEVTDVEVLTARLAARFRQLQDAHGLSGVQLERRTTYGRRTFGRIRNGERLPGPGVFPVLDRIFGTGTELTELSERIRAAQTAQRLRDMDTAAGTGSPTPGAWRTVETSTGAEEVGTTERRAFIGGGLFAAAATAAAISDRIAESAVPPRTLREIERDVHDLAGAYTSTPAADLVPRAEAGWLGVEQLLDARVRGRTRTTLDTRAGQYALYLALTANDLGQGAVADTYLDLAGQHAEQADDRLLSGCVSILDSSFAFFRNRPHHAQAVAAEARPSAHPYARPMLAVCEARAAARAGEPAAARAALGDVWDHLWTGPTLPGTVPVDERLAVVQTAAILSQLADPAAEEHARRAVELYTGSGQAGHLGGAYNALGRTFLRRAVPEPERAADAAGRALAAVGEQRTSWVVDVAGQMWRQLDARWPGVTGVRELGELVAVAARPALPGGTVGV
ncbi:helix-turn-helix transcriptional regulator [Frankia sp. AvcI1]|uniref:helix-turn-helix domain-containing protein n=1 Tax=Frankia sp. AvcI1 TaxID=573496 RepID=UPI002119496B|nr:helix-turn-helix transcriptional regulator [Frankia sp. AvcI1]